MRTLQALGVLFLIAACGPRNATSSATAEDAARYVCDPRRPCLAGYGVCIRCDAAGDPQWEWSDATGSAHVVWPIDEPPDCQRFTFDERGNPLTLEADGWSAQAHWIYDAHGRVNRITTDGARMCADDLAAERACGPPDGQPDATTSYTWKTDGALTVVTTSDPSWDRAWDDRGRLVRVRDRDRTHDYQYDDAGGSPVQHRTGVELFTWRRDPEGRPLELLSTTKGVRTHRTTWSYDEHGHPTLEQSWGADDTTAPTAQVVWTWTHGASGLPVRASSVGELSSRVDRRYDQRGHLVEIQAAGSSPVVIDRAADGRIARTSSNDHECLAPLWNALTGS